MDQPAFRHRLDVSVGLSYDGKPFAYGMTHLHRMLQSLYTSNENIRVFTFYRPAGSNENTVQFRIETKEIMIATHTYEMMEQRILGLAEGIHRMWQTNGQPLNLSIQVENENGNKESIEYTIE